MSSASTLPDYITHAFASWILGQQLQHDNASKSASLDVCKRYDAPVESTSERLIKYWTNVWQSKPKAMSDTNPTLLLIDVPIAVLRTYSQRMIPHEGTPISYHDISTLDAAWRHYCKMCLECGASIFRKHSSHDVNFRDRFFSEVTLNNMMSTLATLGDANHHRDPVNILSPDFDLFYAMRTEAGIVDVHRHWHQRRKRDASVVLSLNQHFELNNACSNDKAWVKEYEVMGRTFKSFTEALTRTCITINTATRQKVIGAKFVSGLEQCHTSLARCVDGIVHDSGVDAVVTGGLAWRSALLAVMRTQLTVLLDFLHVYNTDIAVLKLYLKHNNPRSRSMLANSMESLASRDKFAAAIQKYNLVAHMNTSFRQSHSDIGKLIVSINGLFPVPSGFASDGTFTSLVDGTLNVQKGMVATQSSLAVKIADIVVTMASLEHKAARELHYAMRLQLQKEAVSIDSHQYVDDVYNDISRYVYTENASIAECRIRVGLMRDDIDRAGYVIAERNTAACVSLQQFEANAIKAMQLELTTNVDTRHAMVQLHAAARASCAAWSSQMNAWTAQAQLLKPALVFDSSLTKLTPQWIMPAASHQSLKNAIRAPKELTCYIRQYIDAYNKRAMEVSVPSVNDRNAIHMRQFGVQAAVLMKTYESHMLSVCVTFGEMMRGIEILYSTTTQIIVSDSFTSKKDAYEYKPLGGVV